jgi:hypothetical protein
VPPPKPGELVVLPPNRPDAAPPNPEFAGLGAKSPVAVCVVDDPKPPEAELKLPPLANPDGCWVVPDEKRPPLDWAFPNPGLGCWPKPLELPVPNPSFVSNGRPKSG